MSTQASSPLGREQALWLAFQSILANINEETPPEEVQDLLAKADIVLNDLLTWGLPLAQCIPQYADHPNGRRALKIVFGKARDGLREFRAVLQICLSIREQQEKPNTRSKSSAIEPVNVTAIGVPDAVLENLSRVFELVKGHQRIGNILNSEQKRGLLRALARGVGIDEAAWEPVPEEWPGDKIASKIRAAVKAEAVEANLDFDELLALRLATQYHLEALANRARETATVSSSYLCEPIKADEIDESSFEARSLFGWGYFNPFGPTQCQVTLEFVPRPNAYLLVYWTTHPVLNERTVFGVLPSAIAKDKEQLLATLIALFDQDELPVPLLESPPTYPLFFEDESPLNPKEIEELILMRLRHTDVEDAIRTQVEGFLRFPYQPWERFRAEFAESDLEGEMPEEFTRTVRTRVNRLVDAILAENESEAKKKKKSVAPSRLVREKAGLSDWWALVSDPRHIEAYQIAVSQAWNFAQALQDSDAP